MSAGVASRAPSVKRVGVRNWLRSYGAMARWELTAARSALPVLVIVQLLAGAGFVIGFGLLVPNMGTLVAQYLSTGAVVMSLILIGLIVTPQFVAQQKMEGSYDFIWSLPVPRSAATLGSMTLAVAVGIPGVVVALLVAIWRFDLQFTIHPEVVPAVILTVACGSLLGLAMAHGLDQPRLTMLLTQLLIFFTLGFSPINFPVDRLPEWLATVHEYLPVEHMANLIRSSLTEGLVEPRPSDWIVLTAWTIVAGGITGLVLMRRR
jgi:ABC-2 type transport system permease protein